MRKRTKGRNGQEAALEPQTPAEGILLHRDFGDAKHYTVSCSCTDESYVHGIWIDAEDVGVTVHLYSKMNSNFWSKTRWQYIWQLLTKGHIEVESDIILQEQAALNYAETLKKAVTDVKNFKKSAKA